MIAHVGHDAGTHHAIPSLMVVVVVAALVLAVVVSLRRARAR